MFTFKLWLFARCFSPVTWLRWTQNEALWMFDSVRWKSWLWWIWWLWNQKRFCPRRFLQVSIFKDWLQAQKDHNNNKIFVMGAAQVATPMSKILFLLWSVCSHCRTLKIDICKKSPRTEEIQGFNHFKSCAHPSYITSFFNNCTITRMLTLVFLYYFSLMSFMKYNTFNLD